MRNLVSAALPDDLLRPHPARDEARVPAGKGSSTSPPSPSRPRLRRRSVPSGEPAGTRPVSSPRMGSARRETRPRHYARADGLRRSRRSRAPACRDRGSPPPRPRSPVRGEHVLRIVSGSQRPSAWPPRCCWVAVTAWRWKTRGIPARAPRSSGSGRSWRLCRWMRTGSAWPRSDNAAAEYARCMSPRRISIPGNVADRPRDGSSCWTGPAVSDAWVLEDDYDSEYRYVSRPLGALQGMDPHGRVVYIGTFSKVLFPALRVGYLVAPPSLWQRFVDARARRSISSRRRCISSCSRSSCARVTSPGTCVICAESTVLAATPCLPVSRATAGRRPPCTTPTPASTWRSGCRPASTIETSSSGWPIVASRQRHSRRVMRDHLAQSGLLLGFGGSTERRLLEATRVLAEVL